MSAPDMDAFLKAIDDGDVPGVEAGLAKGININDMYDWTLNEKVPPLTRAVTTGKKEIVDLLIKRGANVDAMSTKKKTPLMVAVEKNLPEIVELLLKAEANPNLQDNTGDTAMWYAIFSSRIDIVQMLIAYGANLNLAGPSNITALIFAAQIKSLPIAKILVKSGADVNAQTKYGNKTALMYAIMNEDKDMIRFLIRNGTKMDLKDTEGETAFDYALNPRIREIMKEEVAHVKSISAGGGGGPPPTSASSSSSSVAASSAAGNMSYKKLFDSSRESGEPPIGAGSYGSVRKIVTGGIPYALKRIDFVSISGLNNHKKLSSQQGFDNEVEILQKVSHSKYAVKFIGFEKYATEGFICTEIFENGQELDDAIYSEKITESNIKPIVMELLAALTSIHNLDILHNDIKPQNIWLQEDNTIKIFDFGFACVTDGKTCKESGGSKTFRKYINSDNTRDKTSDFHALAVTIAKLGSKLLKPVSYKNSYKKTNIFTVEVASDKKPLFLWLETVINRLGVLRVSNDALDAFPSESSAYSSSSAASEEKRTRRLTLTHRKNNSRRRRSSRRH
jgi:ankyrin repeat protein/tRNA A-37 threonylcarbamoyl transferase component Bud32